MAPGDHTQRRSGLVTLPVEADIERMSSAAADSPAYAVADQSVVGCAARHRQFERIVFEHLYGRGLGPPARDDFHQPCGNLRRIENTAIEQNGVRISGIGVRA